MLKHLLSRLKFTPPVSSAGCEAQVKDSLERLMVFQSVTESARRTTSPPPRSIAELEYRLMSQFGDDGIIEYLATKICPEHRSFIEFGVEDYQESNTRLLLQRDNWKGLVIDGSTTNIHSIKSNKSFWRYDLQAVRAFITRENVNSLFTEAGFTDTIGILSIDIDGVDYWVWEAITTVRPMVVICEYNSIFGPNAAVTVPYDASFIRSEKHYSHLYAGASLNALNHIAIQRGMRFLGCNTAGNNAYFVDESLELDLPLVTVEEGFVRSAFREARNENGELLYRAAHDCVDLIRELPVVDVLSNTELTVGDAIGGQSL